MNGIFWTQSFVEEWLQFANWKLIRSNASLNELKIQFLLIMHKHWKHQGADVNRCWETKITKDMVKMKRMQATIIEDTHIHTRSKKYAAGCGPVLFSIVHTDDARFQPKIPKMKQIGKFKRFVPHSSNFVTYLRIYAWLSLSLFLIYSNGKCGKQDGAQIPLQCCRVCKGKKTRDTKNYNF